MGSRQSQGGNSKAGADPLAGRASRSAHSNRHCALSSLNMCYPVPSPHPQSHDEVVLPVPVGPRENMRSLVLDKETEDSRDPQPVKLISHRSRIRL